MKTNRTKPLIRPSQARKDSEKTLRNLPDEQALTEGCQCSLQDLTEEEQKAFDKVIESLAGPTEEEFNRKFQELVTTAAGAANAGKDDEAEQAAMTMLMMAGAKALKNPSPDIELGNTAGPAEESDRGRKESETGHGAPPAKCRRLLRRKSVCARGARARAGGLRGGIPTTRQCGG